MVFNGHTVYFNLPIPIVICFRKPVVNHQIMHNQNYLFGHNVFFPPFLISSTFASLKKKIL